MFMGQDPQLLGHDPMNRYTAMGEAPSTIGSRNRGGVDRMVG